jgi:uncharacterized damage-inducible protein DinB
MISNPWLAQFAKTWQFTRSLTYDFIKVLKPDDLLYSPQLEFGTIGKQLRHLGDVQECYVKALETGVADFTKKRMDLSMEASASRLEQHLREQDEHLYRALSKYEGSPVDNMIVWKNSKLSVLEHLFLLPQHEAIHQGQWSLAARQHGLELPGSWVDNWGL